MVSGDGCSFSSDLRLIPKCSKVFHISSTGISDLGIANDLHILII